MRRMPQRTVRVTGCLLRSARDKLRAWKIVRQSDQYDMTLVLEHALVLSDLVGNRRDLVVHVRERAR